MTTIIGPTGPDATSDDATAAILTDQYGYHRIAFADALRDVALAINPYIIDNSGHWGCLKYVQLSAFIDEHGWDGADRQLRNMGVAHRDITDPDMWSRIIKEKIADAILADAPGIVITDVRFPDEVALIRLIGGVLIRIVRSDGDQFYSFEVGFEVEDVITNDGDLGELMFFAQAPPLAA